MSSAPQCPICLDPVTDGVNPCSDKTHDPFCRDCASAYVENNVNSSYFGSCPVIYCPAVEHTKSKKKVILIFDDWKPLCSSETAMKYTAFANSISAFLCGGCHTQKSLDVGYNFDKAQELQKYFQKEKINTSIDELTNDIHQYMAGHVALEAFYEVITKLYIPKVHVLENYEAWDLFSSVLKIISDPGRRANLHLRYLRDHPKIKTACCSREHCFKCKIKDFHDGKSCMEAIESLDHSVVCCPFCGIALAKGDGCNTVTCVCGKQFSWSAEKQNTERCSQFLSTYPENTSSICVDILCKSSHSSDALLLAKAWQIRNRIDVNNTMYIWFKKSNQPYPSQSCVILPYNQLPEGVHEAAQIWRSRHEREVQKCYDQNRIAKESLFCSMFPNEEEKPFSAMMLTNFARLSRKRSLNANGLLIGDSKLVESARLWIDQHRLEYQQGVEQYEIRAANQFLYLYGNTFLLSISPASAVYPGSFEWCRETSNADLTFTNNNATVERVGSVSCYPAAFAKLLADRSTFKVLVEAAPKTSNWLTFGVARVGMATSSSDGVGRTPNSWGLSDDRSSSTTATVVASCGTETGQFRKLATGDILSMMIDTVEGWCEIFVNDTEFSHRFEIPSGSMHDYCFAMTFANDHRVTILTEPTPAMEIKPVSYTGIENKYYTIQLNVEQTMMLNSLKKHLKALLNSICDDFTVTTDANFTSPLLTDGKEWLSICGSSDAASKAYDAFKPLIDIVLNASSLRDSCSPEKIEELRLFAKNPLFKWKNIAHAINWHRVNHLESMEIQKIEMGNNFYLMYGDDAPFKAALNLAEYHVHNVDPDERKASLAFMHLFADDMNEWYDYDAKSKEPMVDHIDKKCRCLPRHRKKCPFPVSR